MVLYPNTIRIDLWIGTDVNGGQEQILCEDTFGLKTGQTIVRSPPSTLKVNSGQLWDNDSGTCNAETAVFPNYSTSEAALCSGDSTSPSSPSSSSSSTPPISTPSTPADPPSTGSPAPTTLSTVVSHAATTSTSSVASPSASGSTVDDKDCGVTAEWPTPWLGHCVGASCQNFNDCSGELVCQGWPKPVCTYPPGGR